jgi:uncharacterized protein (TIGR02594 family)
VSEFAPAGSWKTPLDVAYAFLGVHEQGGPNRGPMVDQWVRFVGLEPDDAPTGGYPWCAAFVSWCCAQVGYELVKGASVRKLLMRNGDLEVAEPFPGDICISLMANGTGHCGFYLKREHGRIYTLDGNTNEQGSREGNSVALRDRPVDYWDRFLRPRAPDGRSG